MCGGEPQSPPPRAGFIWWSGPVAQRPRVTQSPECEPARVGCISRLEAARRRIQRTGVRACEASEGGCRGRYDANWPSPRAAGRAGRPTMRPPWCRGTHACQSTKYVSARNGCPVTGGDMHRCTGGGMQEALSTVPASRSVQMRGSRHGPWRCERDAREMRNSIMLSAACSLDHSAIASCKHAVRWYGGWPVRAGSRAASVER